MLFGAAAVIPANADGEETVPDKVLDCGDYEVEVDGVIDDVYHQSYSIKHEWADSHWCGGKYDADYLSDAGYEAYYKPNGLEFEYTPYDYENGIEATSYFLWSKNYNYLYVAVEVTDHSIGGLDDEHYERAVAEFDTNGRPWIMDDIFAYFNFETKDIQASHQILVDALGHFGSVEGTSPFVDWESFGSDYRHEKNAEDGLWAVDYIYGDAEDRTKKTGYVV